ncbi:hypothetical protein HJ590_03585 [Naumannella sp. ID2617S]|uniref:hypothetical protein n=1 Tax=Enemella dayhoffiae TaxID=2016507 RepID=UPI001487B33C|nr:hypothetical protein [Enemella dayhoffiae]NNG18666.1 hypothetical protein [Naumannella sp. ID2617S]
MTEPQQPPVPDEQREVALTEEEIILPDDESGEEEYADSAGVIGDSGEESSSGNLGSW